MDDAERRVLEAIDLEAMLAYLCDLISVPSLGERESDGQTHVAAEMRRIGLDVDVWDIDLAALRKHPDLSMEVERDRGLGVAGTLRGAGGGRSLILNGHVDVVPAGDEGKWRFPPWKGTVREGRVYGRGSVDMKGGLCCGLFAAKAIRDAGVGLKGDLVVESVIGEEDGGVGTLATALRGYRADGAVIMEPTGLKVAPSQAGALSFRVSVPGLAAHACVREEGVSAIEKFMILHQALLKLERKRNRRPDDPLFRRYDVPSALNVGTLRAGNWPSSVPESASFGGRLGIRVGESVREARREFERTIATTAQKDGWLRSHRPKVEWWGGEFESASVPRDHPVTKTVAAAYHEVTKRPARLEGMTYGSDMRLMVKVAKTPTVLFGPGDVRWAHKTDESIPVKDLETTVRTLALTALRFCGLEG